MKNFLAILALATAFTASLAAAQTADTVYFGGPIVTVNDAQPHAEAVAVRAGRIIAVGTEADVMLLRGDDTQVVDLEGHTLVPGLIDGHSHFFGFGAQAIGANLLAEPDGSVQTIDDLIAELKTFAEGPDVERTGWIFGIGYDNAQLVERRHPTRDDLDKVSTDKPVIAVHISGHFAVVNSFALEMVNYTADTPDPTGGIIRRRPGSNEPNGVLEEAAAFPILFSVVSPESEEQQDYFLTKAQETALKYGYTTAQEGRATSTQHEAMVRFAEAGKFKIDVATYIDYLAKEALETDWNSPDFRNHYRIAGLKLTLDGSPQGRTAWRTTPYILPPEGQGADYVGYPAFPDNDVVLGLYDEAFAKGWQVLTHANGDAAIDQMLAGLETMTQKYGHKDRRPVLIHGQFVRQDQLDTLARLNIMPSLFPMHTFYWGDWYYEIVGEDAAQAISPMRSALNRGMLVTSHTDAPVALPNLMQILSATVNRTSRTGVVIGPDERLTQLEALKTITLWAAYQYFEEDRKGSIEVGKLADLVILSDNPITIDPTLLKEIIVLETIKEGVSVYRLN